MTLVFLCECLAIGESAKLISVLYDFAAVEDFTRVDQVHPRVYGMLISVVR